MTCPEFIRNLTNASPEIKFSSQELKDYYNIIKNSPLTWPNKESVQEKANTEEPPVTEANKEPELNMRDHTFMQSYLTRKCVYEAHEKKFAKFKRRWKIFYAELHGLQLKFYRNDPSVSNTSSQREKTKSKSLLLSYSALSFNDLRNPDTPLPQSPSPEACKPLLASALSYTADSSAHNNQENILIHHSLAWRETSDAFEKRKNEGLFRLRTAGGAEYLFEVHDVVLLEQWISQINYAAALLSPPPLPSPVGSRPDAFRPSYHFSYTSCTAKEQLRRYEDHRASLCGDLLRLQNKASSEESMKALNSTYFDHVNFIQYEIQRFEIYIGQLKVHLREANMKPSTTSLLPGTCVISRESALLTPSASSGVLKGRTTSLSSLPDSRSLTRSAVNRRSLLKFVSIL